MTRKLTITSGDVTTHIIEKIEIGNQVDIIYINF